MGVIKDLSIDVLKLISNLHCMKLSLYYHEQVEYHF